jgi:hypothetical protein
MEYNDLKPKSEAINYKGSGGFFTVAVSQLAIQVGGPVLASRFGRAQPLQVCRSKKSAAIHRPSSPA